VCCAIATRPILTARDGAIAYVWASTVATEARYEDELDMLQTKWVAEVEKVKALQAKLQVLKKVGWWSPLAEPLLIVVSMRCVGVCCATGTEA
jgi:hypothetical protein